MDFVKDLILIAIGWCLGTFGVALNDRNRRKKVAQEIKTGVKNEFTEIRFQLALDAYTVALKFGPFNRKILEWLKSQLVGYEGVYDVATTMKHVDNLIGLPEEELQVAVAAKREDKQRVLTLREFCTPFLDSRLGELSTLSGTLQQHILEVKAQLQLLNQEIREARYYFEKTFDDSLSVENHKVIRENQVNTYRLYGRRARKLADRIKRLAEHGI